MGFLNSIPEGLQTMTTHDKNSIAAAELADRYIEIILSTKPELLVNANISLANVEDIPRHARRLTEFRLQLMNELQNQPLPDVADS